MLERTSRNLQTVGKVCPEAGARRKSKIEELHHLKTILSKFRGSPGLRSA